MSTPAKPASSCAARDRARRRSTMPREFDPRLLARRALQVIAMLGVLVLIVAARPRARRGARQARRARSPGWIALAVVLRGAVGRLLRADVPADLLHATCRGARAGRSRWSTLAMGSIVPASGAAGLALGGVDTARGRHAGRADRAPLGGVLPDQELGQLRRRRGDRHADGGRDLRPGPVAVADGGAGRRRGARDRARAADPAAARRRGPRGRAPARCGDSSRTRARR